ncbi:MAG: hypothetical protein AB2689_15770 [Candidatus Thiodiazotropha taylori]
MSMKKKDHADWHMAALKISKHTSHFACLDPCIKGLIITPALRGQLPIVKADWLIHLGVHRNV